MQPQTNPTRDHWSQTRFMQPASKTELLVVSNRQPYRHTETATGITVDRPTGGLTEGLDPAMQELGGTWVAWGDGDADSAVVDPNDRVLVPPTDEQYTLRRIWLDEDAVDEYYYGFSNQVLWPLCHSFPGTIEYRPSDWDRYQQVNELFATAVATEATENSVIWFHDYHFALAPSFVRPKVDRSATLQQFWHIPWPSWDVFRVVPNSHTILRGLLGNDRLSFHVPQYCHNFLSCVETALPEAQVDWENRSIQYQGRTISVSAIPMGVPVDEIHQETASREAQSVETQWRTDHEIPPDAHIAIGVDRLDYTKGIPERLDALSTLFETHPEWRGNLCYIQNASQSRSQIPAYQAVQESVTEKVTEINETFGTDTWTPVIYTEDRVPRTELLGLYSAADIAIVSPIRDGLNLVAQEYVAAQIDNDGVLLLSETAGAHHLLGQHAITVDPYDDRQFSAMIDTALRLSPDERHHRMRELRSILAQNDLQHWIDSQLDLLQPPTILPE